jgi:hypothetical protein
MPAVGARDAGITGPVELLLSFFVLDSLSDAG